MNFGVPRVIQSDNGKEFSNRMLREFLTRLNIQLVHGRPRNPRAQGQVERVNKTIKTWLSKQLHRAEQKRWIDHLSNVVYKYNTTVHRATNQSPFLLFHGQSGFNTPMNPHDNSVSEENESDDKYDAWNFSSSESQDNAIQDNLEVGIQSAIPLSLESDIRNHFSNYRERMIINSNPNTPNRTLNIGDIVIIKTDFDNNSQNRRKAFDSFFENELYEVVEVI